MLLWLLITIVTIFTCLLVCVWRVEGSRGCGMVMADLCMVTQ